MILPDNLNLNLASHTHRPAVTDIAFYLSIMTNWRLILLIAALGAFLPGCGTLQPRETIPQAEARVDFTDPVLNRRQVLLYGSIDHRAAERTIQKLLFLDGTSHDPIDLYLQTPGGEFKHFMAIEQIMSRLKSPVNTHALSECNSGGAMLLAAGTGKRRASRGAVIMLHGLKVSGRPPPGLMNKVQDAYTHFWRQRARLPESWLPMPLGVLHVLSAEEALEYGVVDEVVER
jgi:ATP-dependent Clp protease, protease subunit